MHLGEHVASRPRASRIFRGVVFSILAFGQACFLYVFGFHVSITLQTGWLTIDSRWIFPWLALVSCLAFVRDAWRSFRPERARAQSLAQ
jgi:hypothetical protein